MKYGSAKIEKATDTEPIAKNEMTRKFEEALKDRKSPSLRIKKNRESYGYNANR